MPYNFKLEILETQKLIIGCLNLKVEFGKEKIYNTKHINKSVITLRNSLSKTRALVSIPIHVFVYLKNLKYLSLVEWLQ